MNKYTILLMETNEEVFDENWIEEFEQEDKEYDIFNEAENVSIQVNILYVNKRNELERISEKSIKLSTPNKIKKEELIRLVKENEKQDKIKYKLISILVYNLTLKHDELKNFLRNGESFNFMTSLRNIDDYGIDSTINCLQDVNTIFILFNEDEKKPGKHTKRVKFNLLAGKTRRRK
jgi:hypothetical protein